MIQRESVVEDIREVSKLVDGPLTKKEYNEVGEYSSSTAMRRFGSWNKAKEAAGIDKNTRGDRTTIRPIPYRKRRLRQVREAVGCRYCGFDDFYGALDFHHPNDDKERSVMHIANSSWEEALEELKKCEILCANCHRKVTHDYHDFGK